MFWIAWCLFGLTAVQVSESQRRALVHYSPAPKVPSTTPATEETSAANAISKLPTTASLRKDLAKGDFSPRDRGGHNATADLESDSKPPDDNATSPEDPVHVRGVQAISPTRVQSGDSPSHADRPEARTESRDQTDGPRRDDTQSSRRSEPEPVSRDPEFDRDEPRRPSSWPDRGRRGYEDDLDDERVSRGRYDSKARGRESDHRKSKGDTRVYPENERGEERYPEDRARKGDDDDGYDRRIRYRDDRLRPIDLDKDLKGILPVRDERFRSEERYRSRNDDRYRDRDGERLRDRDDERFRHRDDERFRDRDDERFRDRDDERFRDRDDERFRDRDDERFRYRDDERFRDRDDERYRNRDDDKYRRRDEDRYRYRDDERRPSRDDDRYRPRGDEKYRYRDDERYRPSEDDKRRFRDDEEYAGEKYLLREDDRYTFRDDERHRTGSADREDPPRRLSDERGRYIPRTDDDKYVDTSVPLLKTTNDKETPPRSRSDLPDGERKPTNSRYEHNLRSVETVTDYDIPVLDNSRSREDASRLPRPTFDSEEGYRVKSRDDERRRPSRYEDDRIEISPTRTRAESSLSRSSAIDSRPKGPSDDAKYTNDQRDRPRNDDRHDTDKMRNMGIQDSRSSFSTSESSRRYTDDREKYRTRLQNEGTRDYTPNRREEVVLDHRSYASEDEYRKDPRRDYEDRDGRPTDTIRRKYENDESYARRDNVDDEEYRSRVPSNYEKDSSRDRYEDDYRRYDDGYDDRHSSRGDHPSPMPVRRYDTYPDKEEKPRRDPDLSSDRITSSRDRGGSLRLSSSTRDEERSYSRDADMDSKRHRDDSYSESRRYSERPLRPTSTRDPKLGSSTSTTYSGEQSDVVVREKRFQGPQSSRTLRDDSDRPRGQIHPLSAKDVIEAANRQSDASDSNARKVFYPVFDPRLSNLTSPEIIRPSERRGTTITVRKKRSA